MRERWPFFQTRIDMLEMVLAKAEAELARLYDQRLVEADLQVLGSQLRERLRQAGVAVLRLTGQAELLEHHPETLVFIAVRNTYLDPLHLLQMSCWPARERRAKASRPHSIRPCW